MKDALSGRRLDVLEQCVAIDVEAAELSKVNSARDLSTWLCGLYAQRSAGGAVETPAVALLTAGPAAGKSTMMSQVIV